MTESQTRMDFGAFNAAVPQAVSGLRTLGQAAVEAGIEKDLIELVKLRASQINGCAFCLQFHLNIGRKLGIPQVKFDLLAAWRDAGIYNEREQAALLWTETLTDISRLEVSDEIFAEVQAVFPGDQIAQLTSAVAAINAWNRIAVSLEFEPPIDLTARAGLFIRRTIMRQK